MADLRFTISSLLQGAGFTDASTGLRSVGVEAEGATGALEGLNAAAETVNSTINAFVGLAIIQFLKDVVNATAQAETQQLQLKTRVDATGTSFDANAVQINDYLDGIQQLTHVSKEELLPAFEDLITRTHSVREAQELLTTAIGIARGANMSYVEAADLVAGVENKNSRALLQSTKILGLHKGAATDNISIMKDLQATFGAMAETVSPATAVVGDMTNKWTDFKVELGEDVMPLISLVGDVLLRVANFALAGLKGAWDLLTDGVKTAERAVLSIASIVSSTAKDMRDNMVDSMNSTADSVNSDYAKMSNALFSYGSAAQDVNKDLVSDTKKTYDAMNEAEKDAVAQGVAAAAAGNEAKYQASLALLDKQAKAQRKALQDDENFARLTAQDQAAVLESVQNQQLAKRAALKAQYDKTEADQSKNLMTSQVGLIQSGTEDQLQARLKLLSQTTAAEKQQVADSILTEQQRTTQLQTIDNNDKAARTKLYQDFYTSMSSTAISAGNEIGAALGSQLAGQQADWHQTLANVLKMIINSAETAIMANYMVGASQEVAQGGWVGVALGAALIAAGGAAVSAVAGLVADPSSSPSTSGAPAAAAPWPAHPRLHLWPQRRRPPRRVESRLWSMAT